MKAFVYVLHPHMHVSLGEWVDVVCESVSWWVGVACESVNGCGMGLLLGQAVSSLSNLTVDNHSVV